MAVWYGRPVDYGSTAVNSPPPNQGYQIINTGAPIWNTGNTMPYIRYSDEEELGLEPHYDLSSLRNARMAAMDLQERLQDEEAYRFQAEDKVIQLEDEADCLRSEIDNLRAQLEDITKENCWLSKSAEALQGIVDSYKDENTSLTNTNSEQENSIRKLLQELGYIQL